VKYFVLSDIHGASSKLIEILKCFEKEKADKIIILGDILYHGARNPLPATYDTMKTAEILNAKKELIIGVKGNCDSEVDELVLEFTLHKHFSFQLGEKMIFLTHGHQFNEDNLPNIMSGSVLLHGHTHIPMIKEKNNIVISNPGSVGIPKGGSDSGYLLLEESKIILKNITGKIIEERKI